MNSSDTPINYRLINHDDVPAVVELMVQSGFPISGISSRSLYTALCKDAFKTNRIIIGVAKHKERVAAFLLIIVNWKNYWRKFLLQHPILGIKILRNRFQKKGKSIDVWDSLGLDQQEYIKSIITDTPSGRSWSDSSDKIAKAVFLQVDPEFRMMGLAVSIYKYLFNFLISRNIERCDAKVDIINSKAIPLHVTMKYNLERSGNSLFATLDLSDTQDNNNKY